MFECLSISVFVLLSVNARNNTERNTRIHVFVAQ